MACPQRWIFFGLVKTYAFKLHYGTDENVLEIVMLKQGGLNTLLDLTLGCV